MVLVFLHKLKGLFPAPDAGGSPHLHDAQGSHRIGDFAAGAVIQVVCQSRDKACAEGVPSAGGIDGFVLAIGGQRISVAVFLADIGTVLADFDDDVFGAFGEEAIGDAVQVGFPSDFDGFVVTWSNN